MSIQRTSDQTELPNAARVRRLYQAVDDKDVELISSLLASDVVFHIPGTSPVAGEYKGKEKIMQLFQTLVQQTQGTYKTELLGVMANDQYAVTKHRWSAERNGNQIKMDNFNVYRFDNDGKLIERWEYVEDQEAHDKFWS
jgi:ketosteroid isomerase-like protein